MTITEGAAVGGFRPVDADPGAAALIGALDEQASLPAIQRLRAAMVEQLRPRHRLLDVGCGTGEVVRALAGLVGAHGTVVGVEPSATMLDEARRRTANSTLRVEFRSDDIYRLDFSDATFDGVTCERVFQHLDAPDTAIDELVRVTRPGGRIVVIDTDWGMHAIHGADPDLTARIIACWSDNAANGRSGRQLPALFARAGIHDPAVVAETFTTIDPRRPTMAPFTTMADARRERRCHHRCRSRLLVSRARRRWSGRLLLLGRDHVRRRRCAALAERRNLCREGERPVSYFAVIRDAGPAWTDGKGAVEQPGVDAHAAFMNALSDEGVVLFAGPLAGSEHGRIRVLLIVKADNEAVIHDRLAADPWAQAQRLVTTSVEPWNLFVGADRISAA